MYCVFHHISSHLPRQIWFWKISTKTWASVRPPPPLLGQKPKFFRKSILMAPLKCCVRFLKAIVSTKKNGVICAQSPLLGNFILIKSTFELSQVSKLGPPSFGTITRFTHFLAVFPPSLCRAECSSHGGTLVSIHSQEENIFLSNLLRPHGQFGALTFIGIKYNFLWLLLWVTFTSFTQCLWHPFLVLCHSNI